MADDPDPQKPQPSSKRELTTLGAHYEEQVDRVTRQMASLSEAEREAGVGERLARELSQWIQLAAEIDAYLDGRLAQITNEVQADGQLW